MKHIGFDAKRIFYNSTGLGNYSRFVVQILSENFPDNQFTLYSPGKGKMDFPTTHNIDISFPSQQFSKKFSSLWRSKLILKQLEQEGIELFHGLSNELPLGISKKNIKSIVSIHDLIFILYPEWYSFSDRIFHKLKVKNAVKNADAIIAVSEQTKRDIIELLKVEPEKIHVIYQSCDSTFKKSFSEAEKNKVQKKYNLPDTFLLNVGTIEPRKNLMVVVKSLKYHNLPLVVVGRQTKYAEEVKKYIEEEGLKNRVHFLENISTKDLAVIYQLATIFCYPSIYEGFGIPIIEALYSKTPVITNKEGCFKEAAGPDSFYIDCKNPEMLAEKVNLLLKDKDLYEKSVSGGFKYVQKFDNEKIAQQLINLYNQVLKNSKVE